MILVYFSISYS